MADTRRLFRQPRNLSQLLQWLKRAWVLVVSLAVIIVVILAIAIWVWPSEFPPTKTADQWAAEGAVFAAGAFLLAVVATSIASLAYVNSTEKPSLQLTAEYPGSTDPLQMSWNNSQPDAAGQVTSTGERPG